MREFVTKCTMQKNEDTHNAWLLPPQQQNGSKTKSEAFLPAPVIFDVVFHHGECSTNPGHCASLEHVSTWRIFAWRMRSSNHSWSAGAPWSALPKNRWLGVPTFLGECKCSKTYSNYLVIFVRHLRGGREGHWSDFGLDFEKLKSQLIGLGGCSN